MPYTAESTTKHEQLLRSVRGHLVASSKLRRLSEKAVGYREMMKNDRDHLRELQKAARLLLQHVDPKSATVADLVAEEERQKLPYFMRDITPYSTTPKPERQ